MEGNPELQVPAALVHLPALHTGDYQAAGSAGGDTKVAAAAPAGAAAPAKAAQPPTSATVPGKPRASFDQQPLAPPNIGSLNLGPSIEPNVGHLQGEGPSSGGLLGGPPPLRVGFAGAASVTRPHNAAAAPPRHHQEFLSDPARLVEQRDMQ